MTATRPVQAGIAGSENDTQPPKPEQYIVGVMSGTSMDGADAVLAAFTGSRMQVVGHFHRPYPTPLRDLLHTLQTTSTDELDQSLRAGNLLADHYALVVKQLLVSCAVQANQITALAVHGQTVRHCPDAGYTLQLNAPARLAELSNIDVICDFRSRDVAAGGQGAPLVPAFHATVFSDANEHRAVLNLGGMANLTDLPQDVGDATAVVRGWDTGPGNVFLDYWFGVGAQQQPAGAHTFDRQGAFAASGKINPSLLARLLDDPWFGKAPPKSTGRDHFNMAWLHERLASASDMPARDVQASLAQCTAETIAQTLAREVPLVQRVIVCGGGVYNDDLMRRIAKAIVQHLGRGVPVQSSAMHGILPEHVEAAAFAWLAARFLKREPGNRPAVTGAIGPRILGALYPA